MAGKGKAFLGILLISHTESQVQTGFSPPRAVQFIDLGIMKPFCFNLIRNECLFFQINEAR